MLYNLYIYDEEALEIIAVLTGTANDNIEAYALDNFSDYAWCYSASTLTETEETIFLNLNSKNGVN